MSGEEQDVWVDGALAISSILCTWALGWLTFFLALRGMMRGFGSQQPVPPRQTTLGLLLVLLVAGVTLAGTTVIVWWAWRHGFWLTCAALMSLPPCTALWLRRRHNWRPGRGG